MSRTIKFSLCNSNLDKSLLSITNPPKSKKLSVASKEEIFKTLHQIVAIILAVSLVKFSTSMSSSLNPRTEGNSFLLIFPDVSWIGILKEKKLKLFAFVFV